MKVGFIENFISCITKKYFKFSGRASRQEYWKFMAIIFLSSMLIAILKEAFKHSSLLTPIIIIENIWSIFLIIPHWSVAIRRLHDVNKSGWTILLPVIVVFISYLFEYFILITGIVFVLLSIYLLHLFVKKGDVGPNKYGEDPFLTMHWNY